MRSKNFLMLITALLASLFATSCSDPTELGNRAIIQSAAIDYDTEYRVFALLFSSGGSDTLDASKENVIKVTGHGKTLSEAFDDVSIIDGKKIYLAETKLLILGKGFDSADAAAALWSLYDVFRCSLDMPICCAENAEAITDLQFTEGMTAAEKPLSIIENAYEMGVSPKATLLDVLCDNAAERRTLIPYFSIIENGRGVTASDDNETAVLCGARYLSGGRLGETLSLRRTASAVITENLAPRVVLNYVFEGAEKSCEAYDIRLGDAGSRAFEISVKFCSRSGERLSEEENFAALKRLREVVFCE